jgi:hypothetical protein
MRKKGLAFATSLPVLAAAISCCGLAAAQGAAGAATARLYPATQEIRLTFPVPELSFEWREVTFQTAAPVVRSRRFDYEALGLRTERLKLG